MMKSWRVRLAGNVTRMVERRNACRILMVKPELRKETARKG
jgi:hypothetical protein